MSHGSGKVIDAGDTGECRRWQPPVVHGPVEGRPVEEDLLRPLTAERLQALHDGARREGFEQGQREGFEKGYAEGRAAAEADYRQRIETLEKLLECLDAPLQELDRELEQSLVNLALLIARHLVRRELKADPGEVVGVVREAIAQLPLSARHIHLHLNPEDEPLVREALALSERDRNWRIEADPRVSRGGCLVETESSYIDATVEARLAAIVARLLGDEREEEA